MKYNYIFICFILFLYIIKRNVILVMQSRIFLHFREIFLQFRLKKKILEIITIYLTQETCLIIINVENNFAASYFVEMVIHFIFQDLLMHIKFNEQHLFAFIKHIN